MVKGKGSKRRRSTQQRTPLWILLGGLLLIAAAIGLAFGPWRKPSSRVAQEVTGAPRLKVSPEEVDLGDLRLGRQVQVDVRLTNVGDQPLRLSQEPWVEVVEGC